MKSFSTDEKSLIAPKNFHNHIYTQDDHEIQQVKRILNYEEPALDLKPCDRPIQHGETERSLCPIADKCRYKETRLKDCCFLCSDAIYKTLKEEGYTVIPSGRANFVVLPDFELSRKMDKIQGREIPGMRIIVFGDPDSGVSAKEELFITGDRFGVDDILYAPHKSGFLPLKSVHKDFFTQEEELKFHIEHLIITIERTRKMDKEKEQKYIESLKELGEDLGAKIDE